MKRLLLTIAALLLATPVYAQQVTRICFTTNGTNCIPVDASNPFPVNATVSATVTFPTIGAAVPSTGIYNALNVGGTLRGLSGLSTGSLFPAAVAIVDASGNQVTTFGSSLSYATSTLTGWTSATAANTTQVLMPISGVYGAAVLVQLNQTTTISAGAITFEGTNDGTNWISIPVAYILSATLAPLTNPYTLVASTNQPFLIVNTPGYQSIRIKLSTQITGSATVTPFVTLLPFLPVDPALLNPLSAGSAIIGKVGIDQTINGTTNKVASFNATGQYETVAASQTGQTLGPTGGTGDYLSHCTVYPTSTSPGVVTVFDSTSSATNNVISFAGGSTSITNLVPFSFPVGAYSVNGAWKATTGANLVMTCYGKFT